MRTFVAIPLTEEVKDFVMKTVNALQDAEGVRWVQRENLHITLKFLGDILYNKVKAIKDALEEVLSQRAPFTISVEGVGAFPDERRPRVLWFGIREGAETLCNMAEAVNEALSLLSFPKEQFTPHITIARAKNPGSARTILQRARESQEKGSVRMVVKECVLMQSILTPTGPIYRALEQMKMGGKNG